MKRKPGLLGATLSCLSGTGNYSDGYGGLPDGQRAFVLDASSLVPEPGAVGVLAGGALSLLGLRRRQGR